MSPDAASSDPERTRGIVLLVLVGLAGVVLLLAAAFFGLVYVQEVVYPWEDMSEFMAVIHIENASSQPLRVSCRWSDHPAMGWHDVIGRDRNSPDVPPGDATFRISPGTSPLDLRLEPTDGSATFEALRVPFSGNEHTRIRLDEHGRCWVATAGEDWLGGPDWDLEIPVSRVR